MVRHTVLAPIQNFCREALPFQGSEAAAQVNDMPVACQSRAVTEP